MTLDGKTVVLLDGQRLVSGTVVQLRLVRGGWVTGVLLWNDDDAQPAFRMLLDGGSSASPLCVEFLIPASAKVRLVPAASK